MDLKSLLLSADGRIKRQAYWTGWIILFAIQIVGGLVLGVVNRYASSILTLVLIYSYVCVYSKRLHDLGQTGWLAAVPFGLAAIAQCVAIYTLMTTGIAMAGFSPATMGDPMALLAKLGPMMMVSSISGLIGLVFWLWLGIAEGQQGENKYGPEPGAVSEAF